MGRVQQLREAIADRITGGKYRQAVQEADASQTGVSWYRERFYELEASLLSRNGDGWVAVAETLNGDGFSRRALRAMHGLAMVFYLKNPLIRRGVKIQSQYVFGQGVSITIDGNDMAQEVWNDFWEHEDNRRALSSRTRLADLERKLQVKGNLFFIYFVDRVFGTVQVREIDVDEIEDVIADPADGSKPAFYKRVYKVQKFNPESGRTEAEDRTEFYPDWNYNPRVKWKNIGGAPVHWDRPMQHVARERIRAVGIAPSEVFAALDWGKGYTKFLEHRATVAAALSRIVLKFTSKTAQGVAKAKERLTTTFAGTKPSAFGEDEAGGNGYMKDGQNVEAMNVKGATIHPDEGRRLLLMVCASFGFSETFFGDVSVGTLATASSLDRPTELAMKECQQFWAETLEDIAKFVLRMAAMAAANPLSREVKPKVRNRRTLLVMSDGTELWPTVAFPDLLVHDVKESLGAVDLAAKRIPLKKWLARKTFEALGEDDADDLLALLPDDTVLTEWPTATTVQDQAIDDKSNVKAKNVA